MEAHNATSELGKHVKISWTARVADKIHDHNMCYDSDKASMVVDCLSRQKTNVVVKTVGEANALANELMEYQTDTGRVWMTEASYKSVRRVIRELESSMNELGFESVKTDCGNYEYVEVEQ